jgi:C-terminal processing protease CtpA/Prc
VLLRISSSAEKQESIIDTIQQKAYSNLIIDLRNNGGGNLESTFLVVNFLTDIEFISGFLPNRNWYEKYNRPPNRNDIEKFSLMTDDNLETQSEYGFYIATAGSNDSFKGNVYILVNNRTASSAEALTLAAKEYNLATIVGQRTSGGLLNPQRFHIDEDIMLVVPVNDFISYNGFRIEQQGIEPDIRTKRGQELERVMEIIKGNN